MAVDYGSADIGMTRTQIDCARQMLVEYRTAVVAQHLSVSLLVLRHCLALAAEYDGYQDPMSPPSPRPGLASKALKPLCARGPRIGVIKEVRIR